MFPRAFTSIRLCTRMPMQFKSVHARYTAPSKEMPTSHHCLLAWYLMRRRRINDMLLPILEGVYSLWQKLLFQAAKAISTARWRVRIGRRCLPAQLLVGLCLDELAVLIQICHPASHVLVVHLSICAVGALVIDAHQIPKFPLQLGAVKPFELVALLWDVHPTSVRPVCLARRCTEAEHDPLLVGRDLDSVGKTKTSAGRESFHETTDEVVIGHPIEPP
mmetsp:Transcript_15363/g.39019  ORF Transcript_15363/g.39019 Transcript_15363/m.39019 type:complete len:219 (+) Transcript_15363:26-682(+)